MQHDSFWQSGCLIKGASLGATQIRLAEPARQLSELIFIPEAAVPGPLQVTFDDCEAAALVSSDGIIIVGSASSSAAHRVATTFLALIHQT